MKFFISFLFTLFVILFFYITHINAVKYYPACINFVVFLIFFTSIFSKETVIQRITRIAEDRELPEIVQKYTRNLTYVWSVFLFCNFCAALITVFLSDEIWTVYNGIISYVLTGFLFGIEYIVRINFKRKNNV